MTGASKTSRRARATGAPRPTRARDRRIASNLEAWFRGEARDLPWRATGLDGRRDPYRALVSEAMLQQTQVARILERFDAVLTRCPRVEALADADEDDVLAAWSGLGYYRRARLLHRAARAIVDECGGEVPGEVDRLLALPGVGRYTAGSIASLVFGERAPIVDGNVRRVVARLDGVDHDEAGLWSRAADLVGASNDPGVFNAGLMELGALVCAPRAPRCAACPLSRSCVARREDRVEELPGVKAPPERRVVHHASVLVRDARGRRLVEQRPDEGLWARMWQAPTVEGERRPASPAALARAIGAPRVEPVGAFTHQTTHRRVEFSVWRGALEGAGTARRGRWATRREIERLALSNPQRRILLGEW